MAPCIHPPTLAARGTAAAGCLGRCGFGQTRSARERVGGEGGVAQDERDAGSTAARRVDVFARARRDPTELNCIITCQP